MTSVTDDRIDDATCERIALGDGDRLWELWDGVLVEKVIGTTARNNPVVELAFHLMQQLDRSRFRLRIDSTRVRSPRAFLIPDVLVVPEEATVGMRGRPDRLEAYAVPLPFMSESQPPPNRHGDFGGRPREYMTRGDREIRRVHPYDRNLTAWRRREDGSYAEVVYLGGVVPVESLPGVTIDLDAVFAP